MDNRPIGVFDSGVGGLTALKELRCLLPEENIYFILGIQRVCLTAPEAGKPY